MARLASIAKRVDMYQIDPDIIKEEDGWNIRQENDDLTAHIRQLADSIKELGVLEPLTIYQKKDGDIVLTNGHCRLAAVRLAQSEGAEIKTVPVRNEAKTSNDADRVLSMLTRNSGKPLTSLEQACVIKRLFGFGWSQTEIAKKTGYSVPHIGNLIELSSAPAEVQQLVSEGKVSATLATQIVRKEGETKDFSEAQQVKETAPGPY